MRLLPRSGSVLLALLSTTIALLSTTRAAQAAGRAVYVDRGTGSVRAIDDATLATTVFASGLRDPLAIRQLSDGNYLVTERIAFQQPGALTTLDARNGAVLKTEAMPFPVNDALVDLDGTIYLSSTSGVFKRRASEAAFALLSGESGDLGELVRLGRYLFVINHTTGALVRIDPGEPAETNHVNVVDGLSQPIGLAALGGDLLVAESGAARITRVTGVLPGQAAAKSVFAAGLPGASNIWWDGRGFWVTQQASPGAIVKLDAAGKITPYAAGPALSGPRGILHSEPAQLLVTNFNGGATLLRYDAASAKFLDVFASGVSERAVLGPDGDLYGASFWTGTVQRFNGRTGASKGVFAQVDHPTGMSFGPDGNLYVSSYYASTVVRFEGKTGADAGVVATNVANAHGLIFGPDGMLYVSASGAHRVLRIDPVTGASAVFAEGGGMGEPLGLSFGPDGNLYVAVANDASVKRFDGQTGAYLGDFVAPGSGGIVHTHDVAFAPDGSLYAAGYFSNDVHRYDGKTGAHLGTAVAPGANTLLGATYLLFLGNSVSPFCGAVPAPAGGVAAYDLTGTYELDLLCTGGCGGLYPHTMTVSQMSVATGGFSGSGVFIPDPSYFWSMTGNAAGAAFNFHLVYLGSNPGYTIDATGSVAADGSLSGTAANASQTFSFTAAPKCPSGAPAPTVACVGTATAPVVLQTAPRTCGAAAGAGNAGACANGNCTYDGAAALVLAPGDHGVAVVASSASGAKASCTSYLRVVDGEAPALACPAPTVVECAGALTSAQPSAACTDNCSCAASCASGSYALGTHPVSCEARDAAGNVDACTAQVTVRDTTPPAIRCGAPVTVECSAPAGTPATPSAAIASDVCGLAAVTAPAASVFRHGVTPLSFTATDVGGNSAAVSCPAAVTVVDTRPPVVTAAAAPIVLWPPNHKLHTVRLSQCVAQIVDACEGALDLGTVGRFESITANEPLEEGEAIITSPTTVALAARRHGHGVGRVYTLGYSVTDHHGNTARGTCAVTVAHLRHDEHDEHDER